MIDNGVGLPLNKILTEPYISRSKNGSGIVSSSKKNNARP